MRLIAIGGFGESIDIVYCAILDTLLLGCPFLVRDPVIESWKA